MLANKLHAKKGNKITKETTKVTLNVNKPKAEYNQRTIK